MTPTVTYRSFGAFRLLLALLVLVQHSLRGLVPPNLSDVLLPMEVGSTAVLLFFVLSGFIVTEAADRVYATRPVAFLTNRLIRIYPTYLLALAMTVAVIAALRLAGQGANVATILNAKIDLSEHNIILNLFAILPGGNSMLDQNGGSPILSLAWALRIEMLFYLVLFAHLAAAAFIKVSPGRLLAVSGAIGLVAYGALLPSVRNGSLEFFPYFALGVSAYYLDRDRSPIAGLLATAALVLAGVHLGFQPTRLSVVPMILLTGGLLALGWLVWISRSAPPTRGEIARDRVLGDMTYPLYLTHNCGLLIAGAVLPLFSSLAVAGGVGASLVIAYMTAELFEHRLAALRNLVRGDSLFAEPREPVRAVLPRNRTGRIISGRVLRT